MLENSNNKRQQAKDRKTEYFLGNWKIPHISSEIIGPLGRGLWHRVCLPSLQCNYGWPQLSAWNHRNRKLCIESSFKHVFWQAGLACLKFISLKTVRIFISLKFGLENSLNKTKLWPRKWPRKRTRTNVRIAAGRFSKQNHVLQVQNLTLTRN